MSEPPTYILDGKVFAAMKRLNVLLLHIYRVLHLHQYIPNDVLHLKKTNNQLSVTVYCDRKSRVYQSHSLWVRSALTFEVSHSECNGGEEAGHKNSHKNRGSRGRRGRHFSQLQSRRDMVLVKNKTNNMQVTNHDSEDLFCSRSTGYFFLSILTFLSDY